MSHVSVQISVAEIVCGWREMAPKDGYHNWDPDGNLDIDMLSCLQRCGISDIVSVFHSMRQYE